MRFERQSFSDLDLCEVLTFDMDDLTERRAAALEKAGWVFIVRPMSVFSGYTCLTACDDEGRGWHDMIIRDPIQKAATIRAIVNRAYDTWEGMKNAESA